MSAYDGLRQMMTDRCSITVRRPLYAQYEDIRNSEISAGAVLPEGSRTAGGTNLMGYAVETLTPEPVPCRLSFSSAPAAGEGAAAAVSQTVKLFLPPDIDIPAGSRIEVEREGQTLYYIRSGEPARYPGHQEVNLEIWRRWA